MRSDFTALAHCKHDSRTRRFDFSRCIFDHNFANTDPTAFNFASVCNTMIYSARTSESVTSFAHILATQRSPPITNACKVNHCCHDDWIEFAKKTLLTHFCLMVKFSGVWAASTGTIGIFEVLLSGKSFMTIRNADRTYFWVNFDSYNWMQTIKFCFYVGVTPVCKNRKYKIQGFKQTCSRFCYLAFLWTLWKFNRILFWLNKLHTLALKLGFKTPSWKFGWYLSPIMTHACAAVIYPPPQLTVK